MDLGLPDAGRLAWWLTAWLRGAVGPDDALDGLGADGTLHLVSATDDAANTADDPRRGAPTTLLELVALMRSSGLDEAGLALPVDGDPVGLGGPPDFNHRALAAGEAVVLGPLLPGQEGRGLVPHRAGDVVTWWLAPARRRPLVDLGQADRDLREALTTSATRLADLDVARWRPEVADELMALRSVRHLDAPPGTPERCVGLASRALGVLGIAELALVDDGGALSAGAAAARRDAIDPLAHAGRRALVAACSPEVWPP